MLVRGHAVTYWLQLYQLLPCGSHGAKQTQQNSYLQLAERQVMWLHPPFFSMMDLHLGHSLVFAEIQFAVLGKVVV